MFALASRADRGRGCDCAAEMVRSGYPMADLGAGPSRSRARLGFLMLPSISDIYAISTGNHSARCSWRAPPAAFAGNAAWRGDMQHAQEAETHPRMPEATWLETWRRSSRASGALLLVVIIIARIPYGPVQRNGKCRRPPSIPFFILLCWQVLAFKDVPRACRAAAEHQRAVALYRDQCGVVFVSFLDQNIPSALADDHRAEPRLVGCSCQRVALAGPAYSWSRHRRPDHGADPGAGSTKRLDILVGIVMMST